MNSLITLVFVVITASPVANVRCVIPGTPAAELSRATAVFSGKVVGRDYISEETPSGDTAHRLIIKIAVERVWKGDIFADETMYTSEVRLANGMTQTDAEDFYFQDDKQYLIYAFGKRDRLLTSGCTRSREFSKADDDLKELGYGHEPNVRN
jgi:hypothetical protein